MLCKFIITFYHMQERQWSRAPCFTIVKKENNSRKQMTREVLEKKLRTRIQCEIVQENKSYLPVPSTTCLSHMKLPEMKKWTRNHLVRKSWVFVSFVLLFFVFKSPLSTNHTMGWDTIKPHLVTRSFLESTIWLRARTTLMLPKNCLFALPECISELGVIMVY